jgi:hypothetical protein
VVIIEQGTGQKKGAEWVFRFSKRTLKNLSTDETKEAETKNVLTLKIDGDRVTAKFGNDEEGWNEATLTREKAK